MRRLRQRDQEIALRQQKRKGHSYSSRHSRACPISPHRPGLHSHELCYVLADHVIAESPYAHAFLPGLIQQCDKHARAGSRVGQHDVVAGGAESPGHVMQLAALARCVHQEQNDGCGPSSSGWVMKVFMSPSAVAMSISFSIKVDFPAFRPTTG